MHSLSATGTGFLVDKLGKNGVQNWDGAIYFWLASGIICLIICSILAIDEYKKMLKSKRTSLIRQVYIKKTESDFSLFCVKIGQEDI